MGMCKGCNQIFKTEEMTYSYCVDCQKTESFNDEIKLIESEQKAKLQLKDKKFFYIIVFAILIPLDILAIYREAYYAAFLISIFPLFGLFSLIEDIYYNNKQIKDYENNPTISNSHKIKNKKETLIKAIIVLCVIWLLILFPAHSYIIKKYIQQGILPVVIILGGIWVYLAYSKNK